MAAQNPARVAAMTKMLDGYMDWKAADADCKDWNQRWFKQYVFQARGGSDKCRVTMTDLFGDEFNATDAQRTADWLGEPCN